MPRKPKALGSYPGIFFDIASAAFAGEPYQSLNVSDKGAAHAVAHDFNRFKHALARENHPHTEAALNLLVRITNLGRQGQHGKYILEFVPKVEYNKVQRIRQLPEHKDGLEVPGLEPESGQAPTPEAIDRMMRSVQPESEPDHSEEAVEKYLRKGKKEDGQ